jgi:hypothetical protein
MRACLAPLLLCALLVAGCDQLGIETPAVTAERSQADAKAIGGACRHAGRAIEDCYTLNTKASKTAMYTGWREMNDYMRENQIEPVAPVVPREALVKPAPPPPKASDPDADAEEDVADEPPARKRGH